MGFSAAEADASLLSAPEEGGQDRGCFLLGSDEKFVWVSQADYCVSSRPGDVLSTILGSCIAVCIRDPLIACGGMNHFLLPDAPQPTDGLPSMELRYGSPDYPD